VAFILENTGWLYLPCKGVFLKKFVIQVVWGSLTRGMSQTRLEVREDRKIYFGILPSFGDLLDLIVFDLFFPSKYGDFPVFFFAKNSFGQFTSDYFFVITLSKFDKKRTRTHTHTPPPRR
jgi:hypothetical protein